MADRIIDRNEPSKFEHRRGNNSSGILSMGALSIITYQIICIQKLDDFYR